MNFLKSKTNIVLTALIVLLAIVCGILGYSLISSNNRYSNLSSEFEQKSQSEADISQRLSSAENENSSLKSAVDSLESENSSLKDENSNLQNENSDLQKENSSLKQQNNSLKNKSTTSTAPQSNSSNDTPLEQGKVCYLTFDDGPSNNTLKILDILKSYDAKATFFVIGNSKTEYIKNIYDAGHAIGLHSNTHNYKQIYASEDAFLADLNAISAIVEQKTGVKSTLTRFPGGGSNTVSKFNDGIMTRLTELLPSIGYSYFDWNVDSEDASAASVSSSKIVQNVVSRAKNQNTICVLFHDSAAKTSTVKALPEIIEALKNMGFEFRALTPDSNGFHHGVNN